jgi:hypothetical protein
MGTKARTFAPLCDRSIEDLVPSDPLSDPRRADQLLDTVLAERAGVLKDREAACRQ